MRGSIWKPIFAWGLSISLAFLLFFSLPGRAYGQEEEPTPADTLRPSEEAIEAEVQKRLAEREKALQEEYEKRLQEEQAKARAEAPPKETPEIKQLKQKAPLFFQYLKDLSLNEKTYDLLAAELKTYIYLYEDLIEVDEAQYMLADTYGKLGEPGKALVEHLRLIYLYPQSSSLPASRRAVAELADEEFDDAEEAILKVAEGTGAGAKSTLSYSLVKGLHQIEEPKLYSLFIQEHDRFMQRFPTYPQVDEVQFLMSDLYQRDGQPYQAIAGYEKVLAVYPESPLCPSAQLNIGNIYYRDLKEYDLAIQAYKKVPQNYPDSPEVLVAYQNAAEIAEEKQRDYPAAIGYHERIVEKYPRTPDALTALSSISRIYENRIKDYSMAIRTNERIADMFPGDEAIKAYQQAAIIAEKRAKNYFTAVSLYEAIVKEYPKDDRAADALNSIAELYEKRMKDYQKVIQTYERLAHMFPDERGAEALQQAATIAEKRLKDYGETIRIYNLFVRKYPKHEKTPEALYQIGEIYEKRLKDTSKAIAVYQRVVAQWPESELASKAQKRIDKLTKE